MPTTNQVKPTNSDRKGLLNQAYNDLLGRDIGQTGMDYWSKDLDSGQSINDVRASITQSQEFKDRLAGTQAPEPKQATTSTYTPQQREVKTNATVKGQMEGLLSEGSRYLDIARQNAAESANNRGFLNSSMAAGAGERAAIESALPIASQDAGTYNQRDLANMQNVNQSRQFNATADMQTSQFNAGQSNQMAMEQWSQNTQQAHDKTMSELQYANERGLIDQKAYANLRGQYLDSMTQLARESAINISEIQSNPSIPVAEKQQMIDNQIAMRDADLSGLSSLFEQMPMWQKNWSEAVESSGIDTSQWSGASDEARAVAQIDSLYQNLLGRPMAQTGRDYWLEQYRNGLSMADIENSIKQSDEYKQQQAG